jgi:hypothetical protein
MKKTKAYLLIISLIFTAIWTTPVSGQGDQNNQPLRPQRMIIHSPYNGDTRPHLFEMEDTGETLKIVREITAG